MNADLGVTVVVVTPDPLVSEHVGRTIGSAGGRTSSEVLRRTEIPDTVLDRSVAEEFAVLDRVGRLQLPREFTTGLHMRRRVRLELERDHRPR